MVRKKKKRLLKPLGLDGIPRYRMGAAEILLFG